MYVSCGRESIKTRRNGKALLEMNGSGGSRPRLYKGKVRCGQIKIQVGHINIFTLDLRNSGGFDFSWVVMLCLLASPVSSSNMETKKI